MPAGRRLSQLHFDDRSEPVRDLPKRSSRPKAGGAGFYSEANLQTLALVLAPLSSHALALLRSPRASTPRVLSRAQVDGHR